MKNIFFNILIIMPFALTAQGPLTLSLKEAEELALGQRKEVGIGQLNTQIANKQLDKLKAQTLPQVNGTADVRWNTQLQTNVIPAGAFGPQAREVQFGTNFNTLIGVSASYALYTPTLTAARDIAKANTALEELNLEKTSYDIRTQVREAYLAHLYNLEKAKQSQRLITYKNEQITIARAQSEAGTLLPVELKRLNLELSNAEIAYRQDLRLVEGSRLALLRQLGHSGTGVELNLSTSLQSLEASFLTNGDSVSSVKRIELKQEEARERLQMLEIQKQKASYLPTVSAYGNYSVQQLSNNFDVSRGWYPFNYVGVKLEAPIFDGFAKRTNVQEAQLKAKLSQMTSDRLDYDFQQEVLSARNDLSTLNSELTALRQNIQTSEEILTLQMARLKDGGGLWIDTRTAELNARDAQTNYIAAVYRYLGAYLRLQKASGE